MRERSRHETSKFFHAQVIAVSIAGGGGGEGACPDIPPKRLALLMPVTKNCNAWQNPSLWVSANSNPVDKVDQGILHLGQNEIVLSIKKRLPFILFQETELKGIPRKILPVHFDI